MGSPGTCLRVPQPTCTTGETPAWAIFQVGLTGALNPPPVSQSVSPVPRVSQQRWQPGHQGCPSLPPQSREGSAFHQAPPGDGWLGIKHWLWFSGCFAAPPSHRWETAQAPWQAALVAGAAERQPSQPLAGHRAGSGEAAPSAEQRLEAGACWAHLCGSGHPAALRPDC